MWLREAFSPEEKVLQSGDYLEKSRFSATGSVIQSLCPLVETYVRVIWLLCTLALGCAVRSKHFS